MIRKVQNSLTVHGNSRTLKFDNFSEFRSVISDSQESDYGFDFSMKIYYTFRYND